VTLNGLLTKLDSYENVAQVLYFSTLAVWPRFMKALSICPSLPAASRRVEFSRGFQRLVITQTFARNASVAP
jgi:hypothetical protein